jgi:hypothetical protein
LVVRFDPIATWGIMIGAYPEYRPEAGSSWTTGVPRS